MSSLKIRMQSMPIEWQLNESFAFYRLEKRILLIETAKIAQCSRNYVSNPRNFQAKFRGDYFLNKLIRCLRLRIGKTSPFLDSICVIRNN